MLRIRPLSERLKVIIVLLITILLLLPVLIASLYTHPWWDDYVYTIGTHKVLQNGGNIFQVIAEAARFSADKYMNWSGAYAHQFLAGLEWQIFSYSLYKVAMLVSTLFFIICVWFVSYVIGKHIIGCAPHNSLIFGSVISVLTINLMPTPHELLFWLTGACNYTWVIAVLCLVVGLLILCCKSSSRIKSAVYMSLSILGVIMIGGSNHSTALFASILFICAAFIIVIYDKSRKNSVGIIAIAVISILALAVNVLAPGNSVRMSNLSGDSPIAAIINSLSTTAYKFGSWTVGIPLVAALLMVPMFVKVAKKCKLSFSRLYFALPISFCLIASQFAPTFYAQGDEGPGRVSDCVFFTYCWWIMFATFYIVGWIIKKGKITINCDHKIFFGTVVIIAIICCRPADFLKSTSVLCINQFISGEIQTYDAEMNDIYKALENSESKDIVAKNLTASPIIRAGSFGNTNDVRNQTAAKFFNKRSLTVK